MPASLLSPQTQVEQKKRKIKKVPFVELYDGRLQGVVSSGSDIRRVYVSYFEVQTLDYYCSTNNNRPCSGLRGSPCNHLQDLLTEAVKQHGFDEVLHYLKLSADTVSDEKGILAQARSPVKNPAGEVFSRFLAYLQLLEYPSSVHPMAEMDWFPR